MTNSEGDMTMVERRLREALIAAKEKLAIYRAHSTGEYQGGMEYRSLIDLIDTALSTPEGE